MNAVISNTPAYQLLAAYEQFRLGWDYFTTDEPPTVCANAEQKRGYMAALMSASDAQTFAYLSNRGQS